MNAERVQRRVGENENEYDLHWSSGPTETVLLLSNQRRRNSPSRNGFYPGSRVPRTVFLSNVNIFNFFPQVSSSDSIFNSVIQVLLNFLQIQSSGTSPSPFELRPVAFMVSVGSSVLYCLASSAKFVFPGFASQFEVLIAVFGSLAVATLISLTVHLPWLSSLFILLFMGGIFTLLSKLHGNIRRRRRRGTILPL